jgi:hypothetical protein
MNAFISYSIGPNEQYILNLLAQKMAERGLSLVASNNPSMWVDTQTPNDIKNSALFIGLITKAGPSARTTRVFSEFKLANLHSKPAIFLIEDTVSVAPWVNLYENTIRFNRHYPEQAINQVHNKIATSQNSQTSSNAAAWVLGGIGIIALLSWLSDNKK